MRPIVFENHCAACHRLQFDAKLPNETMRHGISAQEVFADLSQRYTAEAVKADPELLRQFVPPRPMPGQPVSQPIQLIQQAVDQKLLTAAGVLFGAAIDENVRRRANVPAGRRGCVECHVLKPGASPIVNLDSLASIEVDPPQMTPVWQEHAFFNHTTHRALDCAVCHAEVDLSKENGDRPLLPDITKCVTCHAPEGSQKANQPGGASSSCTECHRYHNGDNPGEGRAARRGEARSSRRSRVSWEGYQRPVSPPASMNRRIRAFPCRLLNACDGPRTPRHRFQGINVTWSRHWSSSPACAAAARNAIRSARLERARTMKRPGELRPAFWWAANSEIIVRLSREINTRPAASAHCRIATSGVERGRSGGSPTRVASMGSAETAL